MGDPVKLASYEDLLALLRGWRSWSGDDYDAGGMLHLLGACLDNLGAHALDAELDDVAEYLDERQLAVLERLAQAAARARASLPDSGSR